MNKMMSSPQSTATATFKVNNRRETCNYICSDQRFQGCYLWPMQGMTACCIGTMGESAGQSTPSSALTLQGYFFLIYVALADKKKMSTGRLLSHRLMAHRCPRCHKSSKLMKSTHNISKDFASDAGYLPLLLLFCTRATHKHTRIRIKHTLHGMWIIKKPPSIRKKKRKQKTTKKHAHCVHPYIRIIRHEHTHAHTCTQLGRARVFWFHSYYFCSRLSRTTTASSITVGVFGRKITSVFESF